VISESGSVLIRKHVLHSSCPSPKSNAQMPKPRLAQLGA
jgi:hypothetical protein